MYFPEVLVNVNRHFEAEWLDAQNKCFPQNKLSSHLFTVFL